MSLKDIGVGEWVVSVSGDLNIRLLNGMFEEFSHEWYVASDPTTRSRWLGTTKSPSY